MHKQENVKKIFLCSFEKINETEKLKRKKKLLSFLFSGVYERRCLLYAGTKYTHYIYTKFGCANNLIAL